MIDGAELERSWEGGVEAEEGRRRKEVLEGQDGRGDELNRESRE